MILAFPPRESLAARADPYPMGITDYADTGTGTTSYETGSFLANATWTSSFGTQGPNISVGAQMTFQLNVNLAFSANGHWFDYWVQDVAFVDTSHGRDSVLDFENNIWNFSSPAFCLSTSDVEGNGTVYAAGGNPCEGYYADLVNTRGLFTGYSTFQMMVNASVNARGQPEVRFLYDGGPGWVGFDTATFPWVHTLTDAPAFVVNGTGYNPTGYLDYDAEFVMGGPGDGFTTNFSSGEVDLNLAFWNGNNFETVNNAYNNGYDTAETIGMAASTAGHGPDGSLRAVVTSGSDVESVLWHTDSITIVEVEGPGSCDAVVYFGPNGTPYLSGYGTFAVAAIALGLNVSCDGFTQDLGEFNLAAGTVVLVNTGTWGNLSFAESGLANGTEWGVAIGADTRSGPSDMLTFFVPVGGTYGFGISGGAGYLPAPSGGTVTELSPTVGLTVVAISWQPLQISSDRSAGQLDLGQSVQFSTSATVAAGDSLSWLGLPPGCSNANASTVSCAPSQPGHYAVELTVTEPDGFTGSSNSLALTVHADPVVSKPTASPASVDAGQPVTFSTLVSAGSGGDSFRWSGLPSGCGPNDSASVTCVPSAGVYNVAVSVNDSDGFGATSPALTETVAADPSIERLVQSPGSTDVGQSLTLSATYASGSGGDLFAWSGLPTGCVTTNASALTCAPSSTGNYSVTLRLVDSNGFVADARFLVTVDALPGVRSLSASPAATMSLGQTVTLDADVTVGSGNPSFRWNGLPPGCSSVDAPVLVCRPTSTGAWDVSLTVTDSNSGSVTSQTMTLRVLATFLGLSASEGFGLAVGAISAVAVAGTIIAVRLRRRRPPMSREA